MYNHVCSWRLTQLNIIGRSKTPLCDTTVIQRRRRRVTRNRPYLHPSSFKFGNLRTSASFVWPFDLRRLLNIRIRSESAANLTRRKSHPLIERYSIILRLIIIIEQWESRKGVFPSHVPEELERLGVVLPSSRRDVCSPSRELKHFF